MSIAVQTTKSTTGSDFFAPRSALEAASHARTTALDTYYVDSACMSTANARTARHAVDVVRVSDGKRKYLTTRLLVKDAGGYSSLTGVGSWATYNDALSALLDLGIASFEGTR